MTALKSNIIPLSGRTEPHRLIRLLSAAENNAPVGGSVTAPATARLEQRGYVILYRHGVTNLCPGCGKSHWYVGTRSAECAFCGTALDLQRLA